MASSNERVRSVRRTLADGSVKVYQYPSGGSAKQPTLAAGTVGALLVAYKSSPEFAALKPRTVALYNLYLRELDGLWTFPVADIRRRNLLEIRDALAVARGNGAANVFMRTTASLMSWARTRDWIEHSPAEKVRALAGGHLPAWTAAEADRAIEVLPPHLARVVLLARYTGQRRGDLIAMTWRAFDGQRIRVLQEKGRGHDRPALLIPAHPVLRAALTDWHRTATSTHILTTPRGRPLVSNYVSAELARVLPKHGFREHLNVHGLRKLAAASLADAGCSAHEIAAVTGHRTLAMVQLYTQSANQERLAIAAVGKLKNWPENGLENAQENGS